MKILILTGGTGSIALQTGLHSFFKHDLPDLKILTNLYDHGLSTGVVRKVLNGQILGPSDLRKNQTTRHKLKFTKSVWSTFLDIRFSAQSHLAEKYCQEQIELIKTQITTEAYRTVSNAVKIYFSKPKALIVDYTDFSLANIVYAGLAAMNGNSLRKAGSIMAEILEIDDNIIINDDTAMYLGAISESGVRLTDEGDIVEWGKENDPLQDIFFFDESGKDVWPVLNEESTTAIEEADLIILSSGTQWSSLIPTYASKGFKEAIEKSSAKIIMVMNNVPDKDSPGQGANDLIEAIIPKYFPANRVHVLCNSGAHHLMLASSITSKLPASVKNCEMTSHDNKKIHDPYRLVKGILETYFGLNQNYSTIICDYDDTLVARGNKDYEFSKSNMSLINDVGFNNMYKSVICTGNSIKAINTHLCSDEIRFKAFAESGVNEYEYDEDGSPIFKQCLTDKLITQDEQAHILSVLQELKIPSSKIEIRGGICISIKPVDVDFRFIVTKYLKSVLSDFNITESGRSTIDIMHCDIDKSVAIEHIMNITQDNVLYIGDEVYNGNDAAALAVQKKYPNRLTVKNVSSVIETNALLKLLSVKLPWLN